MTARTRYTLVLESALELDQADYQLRRALKVLLRRFGFRCRHVALAPKADEP